MLFWLRIGAGCGESGLTFSYLVDSTTAVFAKFTGTKIVMSVTTKHLSEFMTYLSLIISRVLYLPAADSWRSESLQ